MKEITWKDFETALLNTDAAIIPVGVIEHHGLHAPMGLDTFVAEEIAKRLSQNANALLVPVVNYGCLKVSKIATMWPGTISISPETMANLYSEIGTELARHGVKRIVFVNAHVGNGPALEIAISRIRDKTGAAVGILEWWAAAKEELKKYAMETPFKADHAGEIETSMLFASNGARFAKMERAVANPFPSPSELLSKEEYDMYMNGIKFVRDMDQRYLGASGNYGDPKKASAEKGDAIINATVATGMALLKALSRYVGETKKI